MIDGVVGTSKGGMKKFMQMLRSSDNKSGTQKLTVNVMRPGAARQSSRDLDVLSQWHENQNQLQETLIAMTGVAASLHAQQIKANKKIVPQLLKKLVQLLQKKRELAEHFTPDKRAKMVQPSVEQAIAKEQMATVEQFFWRFVSQFKKRMGKHARLEKSIKSFSPMTLFAIAWALLDEHSSIDAFGAPNIDHLASVFEGVVGSANASLKKPLSQAQLDRLLLETLLTDIYAKGRSPEQLKNMKLAPLCDDRKTTLGQTGLDFWQRATTVDSGFLKEPYMAFTLMHGIPSFTHIDKITSLAGYKRKETQSIYAAVLGHHMAGFIAHGFVRAKMTVNFAKLQQDNQLQATDAKTLAQLYHTACSLACVWRKRLADAGKQIDTPPSLRLAERNEYGQAAASFRQAISKLAAPIVWQLLHDDLQQFTPLGMPKWLAIAATHPSKPQTYGELINTVYRYMIQPYYEESIARGHGDTFEKKTSIMAKRLGMTLVQNDPAYGSYFRQALSDEPAFQSFGHLLLELPDVSALYYKTRGVAAITDLNDYVAWFRQQPVQLDLFVQAITI